MRMIAKARFVDDLGGTSPVPLAFIDRELTTSKLRMPLAEGRALLAAQNLLCRWSPLRLILEFAAQLTEDATH